jgi:hypothetical protein
MEVYTIKSYHKKKDKKKRDILATAVHQKEKTRHKRTKKKIAVYVVTAKNDNFMEKLESTFGSMKASEIFAMWHKVFYTNSSLNYALSERTTYRCRLAMELERLKEKRDRLLQ